MTATKPTAASEVLYLRLVIVVAIPNQFVHLRVANHSNIDIVADGVNMICTDFTRAIDFYGCSNLTLSGLTVDYDPLPYTQGDIVDVNPAEGWLDVKIHAGYPVRAQTRIDIVDRATSLPSARTCLM